MGCGCSSQTEASSPKRRNMKYAKGRHTFGMTIKREEDAEQLPTSASNSTLGSPIGTHEEKLNWGKTYKAVADDDSITNSVSKEHLKEWSLRRSSSTKGGALEGSLNSVATQAHRMSSFNSPAMFKEGMAFQQLAIRLGKDPTLLSPTDSCHTPPTTPTDDRPDRDGPPSMDVYRLDPVSEVELYEKVDLMQEAEAAGSEGRRTPEPGELTGSFAKSIRTFKAQLACRSHETDLGEVEYLNSPCSREVTQKCLAWNGVYAVAVEDSKEEEESTPAEECLPPHTPQHEDGVARRLTLPSL